MKTLSTRAKEELARVIPQSKEDALAELSGLVSSSGVVTRSGGEYLVEIVTDNVCLPDLLTSLAVVLLMPVPAVKRGKHVTVTFSDGKNLLTLLGIFSSDFTRMKGVPTLVRRESEKRAYLRGVFLGSGFLSSGKNNHMEFSVGERSLQEALPSLFPNSATPALGSRDGRYTAYFKGKEKISDVLVYMGATKAALELQSEMIALSTARTATAAQNCDFANIDRAVEAAEKYVLAIEAIDRRGDLDGLDDKLKTTALMRKAYPDVSLGELAEMLGVSKSCAQHRLRKLWEISKKG